MEIKSERHSGKMHATSTLRPQKVATRAFGLALRSLDSRSRHSTRNTDPKLDWNAPSSILAESSIRSPTSSNSSHASFTESGSMPSTAVSSPRSPTVKHEFSDHLPHPDPLRRGSLRPAIGYADVKLPAIQQALEETKLPGFGSLQLAETLDISTIPSFAQPMRRLQHSPAPEPSAMGEYILSGNQDPITECLNQSRRIQKIQKGESFTPLTSPFARGLHIQVDISQPRSLRANNHELQYDAPSNPPGHTRDGRINKRRNRAHCNKKYTKEQNLYIRYHVVDLKLSWKEVQTKFDRRFADPDFEREVQGLQGSMYRQNKFLPKLDLPTNSICYLPNGHMATEEMQVRKQKNKTDYGLVNLFTEEALIYSWVREHDRKRAAEIQAQRRRDGDEAQRVAIENGLWVETTPEDSCACCFFARRGTS